MRCVAQKGPAEFTLRDVATDLGVMRATIYRYYASTDELFTAVGRVEVITFIEDLTEHLRDIDDPAGWVVEALTAAILRLPVKPGLTLLLAAGRAGTFTRGITSASSMRFGRDLFERSPIDWSAVGYDDRRLDELIELMLRTLQSMVIDPRDPPRTESELRELFEHWIAPTVRHQVMTVSRS